MSGGFVGALLIAFLATVAAVWMINKFNIGGGVAALGK
jgi:hypothetical protein